MPIVIYYPTASAMLAAFRSAVLSNEAIFIIKLFLYRFMAYEVVS